MRQDKVTLFSVQNVWLLFVWEELKTKNDTFNTRAQRSTHELIY